MVHIESIERLKHNTSRVYSIIATLAKYGLSDWLEGLPLPGLKEGLKQNNGEPVTNLSAAQRLRIALTELGTTFIKLGQMLSTRSDLFGEEVIRELSRLQSGTPADEPETVRQLFESELNMSVEQCFASFEEKALASASVGQVHRATLHNGQQVVVKIQHHGIEDVIASDLFILEALAELATKYSVSLKSYDPVGIVLQFKQTLERELDFIYERRNLEMFRHNFLKDASVYFPAPYAEYSSKRVLTMEYMDGIPGSNPEKLQQSGIDLLQLAMRGANVFLEMIFRDSFYHADPHPGNLLVLSSSKIGILDCGMTGRLGERMRDEFEGLLLSIVSKDTDEILETLQRLNAVPASIDRAALIRDMDFFLAEYGDLNFEDLNVSDVLNKFIGIIHKHRIMLPAEATMLLRMLILLEGTSRLLDQRFSLTSLLEPYLKKILVRRFSTKRIMARLQRSYRDWDRVLNLLPRQLNNALIRFQEGRLDIQLAHRHLDPIVNRLIMGILVASLFLGSSLLWSLQAPPLYRGVSIFGAAGYGISCFLGGKLFLSIKKSGNFNSTEK